MSDDVQAVVYVDDDGNIILDDPAARGMIAAVEAHNRPIIQKNFEEVVALNIDRIKYFKNRIAERGLSPKDVVIVLIHADDPHGEVLSEILMPGHNWQEYRDRGERPYARGLATRDGLQNALEMISSEAAEDLASLDGVGVVVVDFETARVFTV